MALLSPQRHPLIGVATLSLSLPKTTFSVGEDVSFSGSLLSDSQGVSDEPIDILLDGKAVTTLTTDAQGAYSGKIPSPGKGTHTLKAFAKNLNLESPEVSFDVVEAPPLDILMILGIVGVVAGVGIMLSAQYPGPPSEQE